MLTTGIKFTNFKSKKKNKKIKLKLNTILKKNDHIILMKNDL